MDRGRITVIQHLKIRGVVFFDAAVSEIHMDGHVVLRLGDARDHPDIPVADIVVIAGLHDLVALTEDTLAARSLSLIKSRRIYGISKDFVQSVDSRLGFLPIGG